jgi:putative transposase
MAKSYTNLIYHLVFSTKEHRPFLTKERRQRLYEYIGGIIRGLNGVLIAIGGVEDHIHILCKLPPDKAVSAMLRDLKSNSSGWMHDVFPVIKHFSWQNGYGAFSVSASQIPAVSRYIANQEAHHARHTFRDEFIQTLRVNDIDFDERYLWS